MGCADVQVLDFVLQHTDVMDYVLGGHAPSARTKSASETVLEELVAASTIVCRLAVHGPLIAEKVRTLPRIHAEHHRIGHWGSVVLIPAHRR